MPTVNRYAKQMAVMSKHINSMAILLMRPTVLARDISSQESGPRYFVVSQLARVAKKLFFQTLRNEAGFSRSAYGVWLRNRDDNTFLFCLRGNYGFAYSQHLRHYNKPFTYLDIGANIGLYSLVALTNSHVQAVHSFDPDSATLPYLYSNLEHTKSSQYTVHPYAVSADAGTLVLSKEEGHSGASTLQAPTFDSAIQESITAVNESYLNDAIPHDTTPILVKLDVEGHEMTVLETLSKTNFFDRIQQIYAEFNAQMSDTKTMKAWFENHGFSETLHLGDETHWDSLFERSAN